MLLNAVHQVENVIEYALQYLSFHLKGNNAKTQFEEK